MILSPRRMPPITARRGPATDPAASPMLSKGMFHRFTETPPASPGLPSLRPRHGKRPPPRKYRSSVRLFLWACGVSLIAWFTLSTLVWKKPSSANLSSHNGKAYQVKGGADLPDQPAAIMVTDKRGRGKWTVSIPPSFEFPLRPHQYADICSQTEEVAAEVARLKSHDPNSNHHKRHYGYYHVDSNYMDVAEAEKHGLLPGIERKSAVHKIWNVVLGNKGFDMMNEDQNGLAGDDVVTEGTMCAKSMTYVLETSDAGLGKTLMGLWLSYGLAKKEGRAFFIDDTNWAYGKYTSYFAPAPEPGCLPPPRTQAVPCPHHARHLIVSAATTSHTFGHAFNEEFEDARGMEVQRKKSIFAMIRRGYEDLFLLRDDDQEYVLSRKAAIVTSSHSADGNGTTIGIHVRHGDRHPLEFQYQDSYIPLDRYASTAEEMLISTFNAASSPHADAAAFAESSTVLLASDDPDVYAADELSGAVRAQERIALATKSALDAAAKSASPRPWVDQAIGWEGGFFSALFWSLGSSPPDAASSTERRRDMAPPSDLTLRVRELVGRTYLLDLKVLGEASDGLVCGVSATGCRLLAVMMGWQRAIDGNRWRNVDGDFDWKGLVW